ncbi:MAG: GNAT family N-acetyltransferase [Bacteroidales bacterium]|nr:GNAT family N-acetyltransferase [Bacteroidales bacterium]
MTLTISANKPLSDLYWDFLKKTYTVNPAFSYYFHDLQRGAHYCYESDNIDISCIEIVTTNKQFQGHIAIIQHNDLSDETAFFGFFECINDPLVFEVLWKNLVELAKSKGIKRIMGPINGTIWHSYRIISYSDNESFFPAEPLSQPYYYDLFRKKNPSRTILYHSAYRKYFDNIVRHTKKSYETLIEKGIEIGPITNLNSDIHASLFRLSEKTFRQSWGYVALNQNEFCLLYSSSKISNYIASVYGAYNGIDLIGFCTNMRYGDELIMKTIAVDQNFQQMGIGNALVYKIHSDALFQGIKTIKYALVRKDNKIKYFPKDDIHVFREYAAFEFES